jgi:hypothetical protein
MYSNGQLHVLAISPLGKHPMLPLVWEAVWTLVTVCTLWVTRRLSCPWRESNQGRPTCSSSLSQHNLKLITEQSYVVRNYTLKWEHNIDNAEIATPIVSLLFHSPRHGYSFSSNSLDSSVNKTGLCRNGHDGHENWCPESSTVLLWPTTNALSCEIRNVQRRCFLRCSKDRHYRPSPEIAAHVKLYCGCSDCASCAGRKIARRLHYRNAIPVSITARSPEAITFSGRARL